MIAKRTIAVSLSLALLGACAKNGIGFGNFSGRTAATPKKTVSALIKPRKVQTPKSIVVAKVAPKKQKPQPTVVLASLPADEPVEITKPARGLKLPVPKFAAAASGICDNSLTRGIPARHSGAPTGSAIVERSIALSGAERDHLVTGQLMAGNIPGFMRRLTPVTFRGKGSGGTPVEVTICVTPDYLAVGNDSDFVRVPLGLPAAASVANDFNMLLPTTKMVDAIYQQAGVHLSPSPMQAGSQMSSTNYFWQHNKTVESQRKATGGTTVALVAGQKKDLVLSNTLRRAPGRVAIYGWHRRNGKPIQPLSTVHGEQYADYSHGIRLVSATAYVDGHPASLSNLLEDPVMASILSKEGPINSPTRLMAAISQ